MLTKEDNDLITRAGSGTPLGDLLRRYWVPALLSEEIPVADCPPVQVRILGEELVAFRDSQGRIGLLAEHCSHRGTSLFYGRNEGCALTCVYHGWKYDIEGHVLDTPAEPSGSTFKDRQQHPAYPTHEVGGIIWAYLGPREKLPIFPDYFWTSLPTEQTYVTKCLQECNWLQGLEGECDSSHLSFLHRSFDRDGRESPSARDGAPVYDTEDTDFGTRLIATRRAGPEQSYVRISSFVIPFSCWVPARNKEVHLYVPIDDTHSWRIDFGFVTDRPLRPGDVARREEIDASYHKMRTAANHYLQDREAQRSESFTGMATFLSHDSMATESMGALFDRGHEHLGSSDKGVMAVRQRLLNAIKGLQRGEEPPHLVMDPAQNDMSHIDIIAETIDGTDWRGAFPHVARTSRPATAAARQKINLP